MEISISESTESLKDEQKAYYTNFSECWNKVTQRVLKGLDNPPKNFKGGFKINDNG